jgi:hypothetical protein
VRFGSDEVRVWNFQIVSGRRWLYARSNVCRHLTSERRLLMLSALLETVGALGVLASVVIKLSAVLNEYRRRADICDGGKVRVR